MERGTKWTDSHFRSVSSKVHLRGSWPAKHHWQDCRRLGWALLPHPASRHPRLHLAFPCLQCRPHLHRTPPPCLQCRLSPPKSDPLGKTGRVRMTACMSWQLRGHPRTGRGRGNRSERVLVETVAGLTESLHGWRLELTHMCILTGNRDRK